MNIELHSEQPNMEFLKTAFHYLSNRIEALFMDQDIRDIRSKKLKDHPEKEHYTEDNWSTTSEG